MRLGRRSIPVLVKMFMGNCCATRSKKGLLKVRKEVPLLRKVAKVAVLEKAVEVSVSPSKARLEAGQRMAFGPAGLGAMQSSDASVGAWRQGSIIAIDRPLGELLADLSRYRPGLLHCDPQIAGLKVSGAFPIDNTDRALAALESGFGLKVSRYTPYWVRVRA